MHPSRRQSFAAIVVFGLLPFAAPLLRGEIFSFRDHSDYFVPFRYFTAQLLRSGELPVWNPYNGAGERWLANPQAAVFYPPAAILLVSPFRVAYMLFLAFHVILLGAGSLLLFRRWCSPSAALLGAVCVMLGGPSLSLLDINNNLATFAWLPLLLWIASRSERSLSRLSIPAGCVLALMFLAGEPYLAFVSAVIFAAILLSRREVAQLAVAALIAAGLAAVQLLPFLDMLRGSDRATGLSSDLAFAESLAPADWSVVALWPQASPTRLIPTTQYFIPSLYLGPVATFGFLLAVFSVARGGRPLPRRALLGFAALFGAFALIAAGVYIPPLAELIIRIGAAVSRHASRVAPVAALGFVGIAAIGLDRLGEASRFARTAAFVGTVVVAGLAAMRVVLFWRSVPPANFAEPLLALTALGVLVLARPRAVEQPMLVLAACALVAIDLVAGAGPLLASEPFSPTVPEYARVMSSDRRILRLAESHEQRLFRFDRRTWYAGYLNLFDRKFDVSTPAPVVSERYLRLHDTIVAHARLDVADFLSAAYIATSRELDAPALSRLARIGSVNLYRNANARPMMNLWRDFVPAATDEEALRLIETHRVDLSRTIVVSAPPDDLRAMLAANPGDRFDARIAHDIRTSHAGAYVRTTQPVILSFGETDAKGWMLTIDGRPAQSLRINALFLGAFVPAGEHRVSWTYHVPYLFAGGMISIFTLAAASAAMIVARRRRARDTSRHVTM